MRRLLAPTALLALACGGGAVEAPPDATVGVTNATPATGSGLAAFDAKFPVLSLPWKADLTENVPNPTNALDEAAWRAFHPGSDAWPAVPGYPVGRYTLADGRTAYVWVDMMPAGAGVYTWNVGAWNASTNKLDTWEFGSWNSETCGNTTIVSPELETNERYILHTSAFQVTCGEVEARFDTERKDTTWVWTGAGYEIGFVTDLMNPGE